MIVPRDAIYYHSSGLWRSYRAGEEAPGEGWQTEPFAGVDLRQPEPAKPDPFDHDGDGAPGGSLPKPKRKYVRKAK